MAKGIDCASPLNGALAAAFVSDGYAFVCRYLVPSGWKRLTKEEADIISKAGLQIVSVFEVSGNQASVVGGNGANDGRAAYETAQAVGQPGGSVIYFAVDYEAGPADMDNIEAYLRAADAVTPGYHIGVYGSKAVIEAMKARGVCHYFWQTVSWSNGKRSDAANIYQSQIDTSFHGIGVDFNESFGNEGWWNTMQLIPKGDSDKLTAMCAVFFKLGVTQLTLHDGSVIKVDPPEIHRLADVVRAASEK